MYEKYYGKARSLLAPQEDCRLFPTIDDRDVWENMPQEQKDAFMELGEPYYNYSWPTIRATDYMQYARTGNRNDYSHLDSVRRNALLRLVMAECVENKGRFVDDIINGFWIVLDEASWVQPAHNSHYPPAKLVDVPLPQNTTDNHNIYIDHYAGDTGVLVAVLAHIIRPRLDAVTPMVFERIDY